MQVGPVFHILGWLLVLLAGLMLLPILFAFDDGQSDLVSGFLICAIVTGFVGAALMLSLRSGSHHTAVREGILLMVFGFLIVSFFASFPFAIADGFPTLVDAWFESASGLTTTGATLITDYNEVPRAIFVWRGLLQWVGGGCFVIISANVLTSWTPNSLPLRRVKLPSLVFGDFSHDLIGRIRQTAPPVFALYSAITFAGFLFLWIDGLPVWEAFCLIMSTVSTGGFITRSGGIEAYGSGTIELTLFVVMTLASLNLFLHWRGIRGKFEGYRQDLETRQYGLFFILCVLAFWLTYSAMGNPSDLWASVFDATAMLSTTGWSISASSVAGGLPMVLLFPVLIGGAAISTTGGFKIARFSLLIQHSMHEMKRLCFPHGQFHYSFNDRRVPDETMSGVWGLFLAFMAVTAITALIITFAGFDFETAIAGSISIVMNAGPALDAVTAGETTYSDFPSYVRALLILAMIAGRVEVLAVFALMGPRFWRV